MSPRTGRPKADNPKEYSLKIRFDKEFNERMQKYCETHSISKTDLFRTAVSKLLDADKKK